MKNNAIYYGNYKKVLFNHFSDESVDLIYCNSLFPQIDNMKSQGICRSEKMEIISKYKLTYESKLKFKSGIPDLKIRIEFKSRRTDL